jgi:hypothetical protein
MINTIVKAILDTQVESNEHFIDFFSISLTRALASLHIQRSASTHLSSAVAPEAVVPLTTLAEQVLVPQSSIKEGKLPVVHL